MFFSCGQVKTSEHAGTGCFGGLEVKIPQDAEHWFDKG